MRKRRNVILTLILISLMALVLFAERPIWVTAQTAITPSVSLTVNPNPTGIGFPVTIIASVQPAVPAGDWGIVTFTLNVTSPNGTYQVLSPFEQASDPNESDSFSYQYTPTEKGDFVVTFNVSGAQAPVLYLPAQNQTILTAVQSPYPSTSPLPSPTLSLNSESQFRIIDTVQVGGEPVGVAYDSGKNEIFVVNQFDGTLSVISDRNNTVVATVPVGIWQPSQVAYDSGKGEIFVTNSAFDTVSVISDSSNSVVANITLNQGPKGSVFNPTGIAYDSGKGEIFVTDDVDMFSTLSGSSFLTDSDVGMVSIISDKNNTVIATIPVDYSPSAVAYDSGKSEVFVTTEGDYPTFAGVSVISDSNNTVVANIPVGNSPDGVTYDSGKGEIFVANSGDNTTSVISDSNNTVVATLAVGSDPQGVAYDSGKGEVFVANHVSNSVSIISDNNNTVIGTVTGVSCPQDLTYDSRKSEILVTKTYFQFNFMEPPSVSDTLFVISDYLPLAAPSVSASTFTIDQGQTAHLTSTAVTTGVSPYTYQWFSEAPSNLSYTPIGGATASSYNFTTLTSTADGNWTFILQVIDATGAAVNSTVTVTVNMHASNQTPASSLTIVVVMAAVAVAAGIFCFTALSKAKKNRCQPHIMQVVQRLKLFKRLQHGFFAKC